MKKLKVYGERNSGTNYLEKLLDLNLEARIIPGTIPSWMSFMRDEGVIDLWFSLTKRYNFGWKHALPPKSLEFEKILNSHENVGFVAIVKNPYWYLRSLYRRPYHYNGKVPDDFRVFITKPWKSVRRAQMPHQFVDSPVQLWNIKVERYLELAERFPDRFKLVRYEDVVQDPKDTILDISESINQPLQKQGEIVVPTEPAKKGDKKTLFDYRRDIEREVWLDQYKVEELEAVNSNLDFKLLKELHYDIST